MNPADRVARIEAARIHDWFEGPNGVEEAMALPQTLDELVALLKVMGVQVELKQDSAVFTSPEGLFRTFLIALYPWDDPWLRPAAVAHAILYDPEPYMLFGN